MSLFGTEKLAGSDVTDGLGLRVSDSPISYWRFLFLLDLGLFFRLIVAITNFAAHRAIF
jgi:hypothetical protein